MMVRVSGQNTLCCAVHSAFDWYLEGSVLMFLNYPCGWTLNSTNTPHATFGIERCFTVSTWKLKTAVYTVCVFFLQRSQEVYKLLKVYQTEN